MIRCSSLYPEAISSRSNTGIVPFDFSVGGSNTLRKFLP